jgi:hypothetical protein
MPAYGYESHTWYYIIFSNSEFPNAKLQNDICPKTVSCQFDILLNVRQYVCSETYLLDKMSVQKYEIRTYIGQKFVILKFGFRKNNLLGYFSKGRDLTGFFVRLFA